MANEPVILTGMILKTKDGVIPLLTNSTPKSQAPKPLPRKLWLEGSYAEEREINKLNYPGPEKYHP